MITSPGALAASPSPGLLAIWVLWPLGVNVHSEPGASAPVVGGAEQSTELDVDGSRVVAGKNWLKVSAADQSGLKGWVLDDPGLVIHQAVNLHIDTDQSWSMVFPTNWNVQPAGASTGVTTLTGDGVTMTVDLEPATPTPAFSAPGSFVNDQQIELYGVTTVLSTYKLVDGSYEFVTRHKWKDNQRYFTVTYKEPAAAQPDTSLCLQLITGIKIT